MHTPTLKTRADIHPHDHAVFVYDDVTDILVPLERFLHDAADRKELAAFVHSFAGTHDARLFVGEKIAALPDHERDGVVTMAHYRDAFEKGDHIDHDHAVSVVGMLKETASGSGKSGVRIFVDASKNYFDAGRTDEWFAFERFLGPRLKADVGLVCAYRASDLEDPHVLRQVLETHAYRFGAGPR